MSECVSESEVKEEVASFSSDGSKENEIILRSHL